MSITNKFLCSISCYIFDLSSKSDSILFCDLHSNVILYITRITAFHVEKNANSPFPFPFILLVLLVIASVVTCTYRRTAKSKFRTTPTCIYSIAEWCKYFENIEFSTQYTATALLIISNFSISYSHRIQFVFTSNPFSFNLFSFVTIYCIKCEVEHHFFLAWMHLVFSERIILFQGPR